MLNIGSGELVLIAVVALLVLGPKRLPELARGIGKFLREFRRQTDDVRGVVEREFYKMDQELDGPPPAPVLIAAEAVPYAQAVEQGQAPAPLPPEAPASPAPLPAPAAPADPVAGEPEKKAS